MRGVGAAFSFPTPPLPETLRGIRVGCGRRPALGRRPQPPAPQTPEGLVFAPARCARRGVQECCRGSRGGSRARSPREGSRGRSPRGGLGRSPEKVPGPTSRRRLGRSPGTRGVQETQSPAELGRGPRPQPLHLRPPGPGSGDRARQGVLGSLVTAPRRLSLPTPSAGTSTPGARGQSPRKWCRGCGPRWGRGGAPRGSRGRPPRGGRGRRPSWGSRGRGPGGLGRSPREPAFPTLSNGRAGGKPRGLGEAPAQPLTPGTGGRVGHRLRGPGRSPEAGRGVQGTDSPQGGLGHSPRGPTLPTLSNGRVGGQTPRGLGHSPREPALPTLSNGRRVGKTAGVWGTAPGVQPSALGDGAGGWATPLSQASFDRTPHPRNQPPLHQHEEHKHRQVITVEAAMIPPQSFSSGLKKTSSAIGSVDCDVSLMMNDFANRKSFHAEMNEKTLVATSPGKPAETGSAKGTASGSPRPAPPPPPAPPAPPSRTPAASRSRRAARTRGAAGSATRGC